MPGGGVRLDGGPVLTDTDTSLSDPQFDSASSIVDISDARPGASDSDFDGKSQTDPVWVDGHKYRMPDVGKTRLCVRTKEPMNSALDKPLPEIPTTPLADAFDEHPAAGDHAGKDPLTNEIANGVISAFAETPSTNPADEDASRSTETEPTQCATPAQEEQDAEALNDSDPQRQPSSSSRPSSYYTMDRPGSIYTLGRASFTGQLAQLTSMRLPDADSLAKRISALPTATEAAKALADASEQIRMWIAKANDVLDGLNAEDDVEWAAAGGSEGIEDVDKAINRFQRLVEVYILSIERLQTRDDIGQLSPAINHSSVEQMECVMASWKQIKDTLRGIKLQVEIALEWQKLWDNVLGEIAQEMESLHRLVFEMEEKRHQGSESVLTSKDSIDISELETIVEEQPGGSFLQKNRMSIAAVYANGAPMTPPQHPSPVHKDDSSLLALFARMQPLRASLDFLPMRLSGFQARGKDIFPGACEDLENRREQLESQWRRLEEDAESLRRELGEDRWVTVFRNAGRQALKMCESITRSFQKLHDSIDAHEIHTSPMAVKSKVENYEQKRRHYGPAIERVLAIIDRGVTDRLTVNGEILRLQGDMKRRWAVLQSSMREIQSTVEVVKEDLVEIERDMQLRDSVSNVVSTDRLFANSLGVDTPGSSPASSVIMRSRKDSFGSRTPTPVSNVKLRSSSGKSTDRPTLTPSSMPRRTLLPKKSTSDMTAAGQSVSEQSPSKLPPWPSRPEPAPSSHRPRFRSALRPTDVIRDFKPLSVYEPSPYAKSPVTPKVNYLRSGTYTTPISALTSRVPTSRNVSAPATHPPPSSIPRAASSMGTSRKSSLPVPTHTTPSRSPAAVPAASGPRRTLKTKASAPVLRQDRTNSHLASGRRSSMMPAREGSPREVRTGGRKSSLLGIKRGDEASATAGAALSGNEADNESPRHYKTSSPNSLAVLGAAASGRASATGRRSSILLSRAGATSRAGEDIGCLNGGAERPKWRP
jgi:hypothetical protein